MVDSTIATKVNADAIIAPKRGAIFVAPVDSPLPTDMTKFKVGTDAVDPWHNLGHTSIDNLPTFDTSGGDTTSFSTWQQSNVRTSKEDVTLTMTAKSVQADTATLKLLFGGWDGGLAGSVVVDPNATTRLALIVMAYDSTVDKAYGIYVPRATITADGVVDLSTDFAEFAFKATFEASPNLPKKADGTLGTYVHLNNDSFKVKAGA